ncbi:hypothetical protein GALMADRAFT_211011 [Galerina marginata CBS 339.88]|uniref:Uncharacterized protein n=1 Tax=Galerina marginata (strain CBS 339.88) TaxID=685588 RepID=A0A067T938_GALM3|nr:hypothetical protein GALMADRAFT_211011 [Galerina marginata CBS 339.88]
MALSMTQTPYHKRVLDVQFITFEVLPYRLVSPDDAYEDDAFVYSGSGTMCHQELYPRKSTARLVVSRPRKPLKKATPSQRKKIQWPDAHDIKGLALFCQKQLGGLSNLAAQISNTKLATPMKNANLDGDVAPPHAPTQPLGGTSIVISGQAIGRPVFHSRFVRGAHEY